MTIGPDAAARPGRPSGSQNVDGGRGRHTLSFVRVGAQPSGNWDAVGHLFRADVAIPASAIAERRTGTRFLLHVGGIATVSELWMNGTLVHRMASMFEATTLDVSALVVVGLNHVEVRVLPLTEWLAAMPRRPRPRWRTRLVEDNQLRWVRTTLLGRCPGIPDRPPVVGPWRPMVLELRREVAITSLHISAEVVQADGTDGDDPGASSPDAGTDDFGGIVRVSGTADVPAGRTARVEVVVDGPAGQYRLVLDLAAGQFGGELRIPHVERWWPHTHGRPTLYEVRVCHDGTPLPLPTDATNGSAVTVRRIGFRTLSCDRGPDGNGFSLVVNGVPIFCRGAVWSGTEISDVLVAKGLGMNMLRIPGIAWYESDAFYDRCDELGILVWQDLTFANLDYPHEDETFAGTVRSEIEQQVGRLAGRPSWVVLCGSSEVEQQAAMFGLPAESGQAPTLESFAAAALQRFFADPIWVPSTPSGGDLPFRTNRGVSHYFGVGAYRRPLFDVRIADVRFAAECLAFANVPAAASQSDWTDRVGVPRDNGADWDFADITEHYGAERYHRLLTGAGGERHLGALNQEVTGSVMSDVLGQWRRTSSNCAGALVLWLRDRSPGAGWGLLAADGRLKPAAYQLRRMMAPTAVWFTDEGLNELAVHIANDPSESLEAELTVQLFSDHEISVGEARVPVKLPPHGSLSFGVEELLGRFVDVSYAYRFGPPAQDLVVATLRADVPVAQAFFLPAGAPERIETAAELGVVVSVNRVSEQFTVRVVSRRFLWSAQIEADGFTSDDSSFNVAPGGSHTVVLSRQRPDASMSSVRLTALNLEGPLTCPIPAEGPPERASATRR